MLCLQEILYLLRRVVLFFQTFPYKNDKTNKSSYHRNLVSLITFYYLNHLLGSLNSDILLTIPCHQLLVFSDAYSYASDILSPIQSSAPDSFAIKYTKLIVKPGNPSVPIYAIPKTVEELTAAPWPRLLLPHYCKPVSAATLLLPVYTHNIYNQIAGLAYTLCNNSAVHRFSAFPICSRSCYKIYSS